MEQTSKQRHEDFVKDLEGGPLSEVFAVSATVALLFVLSAGLKSFTPRHNVVVDFAFAVFPSVLLVTVLSDHVFLILFLLLLLLPFLGILIRSHARFRGLSLASRGIFDSRDHPAAVSCFRGLMLFSSSVCILGVDFPAFPRRFAKAETFGTGVMDVGVGSFAVAMGLVSSAARGITPRLGRTLCGTVVPLLVLGALRTVSVKAAGYQEHASEYGMHWNFFFTLAFSKLLVTLVNLFFRDRIPPLFLAISVSLFHAAQLRLGGQMWALEAPRVTIFSANKEGLVSLPAFVALELWGTWLGMSLRKYFSDETNKEMALTRVCSLLLVLTLGGAFLTCGLSPVSRRFGNTAYLAWAISNTAMTLLIFLVGQLLILGEDFSSSRLPSRFGSKDFLGLLNRFAMFHFLASNLVTGLVNFSMDTLTSGHFTTVCVLVCYQTVLIGAIEAFRGFSRRVLV